MAAPTVRSRTTPAAGLSATSGAGTAIGDMVICFTWERAGAGVPTHTLQANFVEIISKDHNDGSTDGRLSIAYKIATASGANSYQAYTSSVGTETWTGLVVVTVATFAATATNKGPTASAAVTTTTNAAPDPPDLTLGATRDWLVLVVGAWHHSASATITPTAPTNYANLIEVAGASTGDIGIADRSLTAPASENPGAFGDNIAPNGASAATIGIASPILFTRTAAIDGVGAVTAAATFFSVFEGSGAIGATADVSASGTFFTIFERSSAIGATGAIESAGVGESGSETFERTAAIDCAGAITTAGQRDLLRSMSISATAGIETSGFAILERSAALGASGSVSTSAEFYSIFERSTTVNADGSVAVSRQVEFERTIAIDGAGGIASSGFKIGPEHERSASLGATGSIAVSGVRVVDRGCSLSSTGSISVSSQRDVLRSASLSATASISVSGGLGAQEFERSASFLAVAGITVRGGLPAQPDETVSMLIAPQNFRAETVLQNHRVTVEAPRRTRRTEL